MNICFKHVPEQLAPFVESIWVFESQGPLPDGDLRTILPNGRLKVIVPFKSDINIRGKAGLLIRSSSGIFLGGMIDTALCIASEGAKGTIGIELKVNAAYRFFNFPLKSINNRLHSFGDIFGRMGRELERKLADCALIDGKIDIIEAFLMTLSNNSRPIALVEYAANEIAVKVGILSIGELCKDTGYSKRYLERIFGEHVGLGPKRIACINRFQKVLKNKMVWHNFDNFMERDLYNYYFDQSHFIKEFKRFSGLPPGAYAKKQNLTGEIFSRRP